MNHCSSEGPTVGILSYLYSRLTLNFILTFAFQNSYTKQNIQFNFKQIRNSFSILHQIQIQIKMQETIHLSDLSEHTITKIFKHDPESELGIMIRQWVIYNKLEDFNSLLNYTDDDLIPHGGGNLSYYKENGDFVVKLMTPIPL